MRRAAPVTLAAAALALLAGCPASPFSTFPDIPTKDALQVVMRGFALRDATVHSLRARLRVKIQPDEGKAVSTTVMVTLRRPGALRVEPLGPVDELEGLFVLRDGRYAVLSMPDKRVTRGAVTDAVFDDALGLRLPLNEVEAVLCGAFAVADFTQGQIGEDEPSKEIVILVETPGGRKQIIRADRETLAAKKVEVYDGGERRYTLEFSETSPVMGIPFAHRFKASFEGRLKSVDVKYREIEVNPEISDEEFAFEVPPGFAVEER